MKTTVRRWGNSLALRIPKAFADQLSVRDGDAVDVDLAKGRMVVTPRRAAEYRLADLVAKIRPANLHEEMATGGRVGREAW